ncbi:MAG: S9 family peptidase [Gemmatimonadales bacterium]
MSRNQAGHPGSGWLTAALLPLLVASAPAALASTLAAQEAALQEVPRVRRVNDGNVVLDDVPAIPASLGDRLRRYENVRSASFAAWDQDGRAMYISTRFGETSQLHRVDMPRGARTQLTFLSEPITGAVKRPETGELLFGMDEGGAEFYQLFLFDPRTAEYRRLTDGVSRNGAPEFSRNGKWLAFRSTRRNGRSNDVWIMEVADTSSSNILVEAPDGAYWGPADWDAENRRVLGVQYVSITDSRIWVVDVMSGDVRLVAGGDQAPGNYSGISPRFAPDGRGAFLSTDRDSEFNRLVYVDLETGAIEPITSDIDWDVEGFALSEDGRRAAFTVNEDGRSRLYLMDPAARQYAPVPEVPLGRVYGIEFSPDGRRLAMTISTADSPSDVYTLELGEGVLESEELTRWTYSEIGGLSRKSFVEPELIHYPTFDSGSGGPDLIPAFVYRPRTPGPHPVIVSIHGGPESQYRPGFSSTFQMWVNELGAAVIAPNVRGSSGYGKEYVKLDNGRLRENSVRDIGALLDWIAEQPDLDASRVAVYGGSYGGYMVLASLVHYSERLRAGVEIVGISNFVTFLENTQDYRRDARRVEYGDERDPEMRTFLDGISPNRSAESIRVPLLVAQGQNDPRVPVTESDQVVTAVRRNLMPVWYMKALNEGHGFRKKENSDLYRAIAFMFLEKYLMAESPVAAAE